MSTHFREYWASFFAPILPRRRRSQVAALCHRQRGKVREYLLISSRDTGRWIIPKGWPIDGLTDDQAAVQEAWEEAGVTPAAVEKEPIGSYRYDKRVEDGADIPVEAAVYSVAVAGLADTYPEVDERTRQWVSADKAAELVDEADLKDIFRDAAAD